MKALLVMLVMGPLLAALAIAFVLAGGRHLPHAPSEPPRTTAVLIDTTDPWTDSQRAFLKDHLRELAHGVGRGQRLSIYLLSGASLSPQELWRTTSPGTAKDANRWTEGDAYLEERFSAEVLAPLDSVLLRLEAADSAACSPILESFWQLSQYSEFASTPRPATLFVASDLLQNTSGPGGFSFYRADRSFFGPDGALRNPKWKAGLTGITVTVWWLRRDRDEVLQGPALLAAYTDYFEYCGADSVTYLAVAP